MIGTWERDPELTTRRPLGQVPVLILARRGPTKANKNDGDGGRG